MEIECAIAINVSFDDLDDELRYGFLDELTRSQVAVYFSEQDGNSIWLVVSEGVVADVVEFAFRMGALRVKEHRLKVTTSKPMNSYSRTTWNEASCNMEFSQLDRWEAESAERRMTDREGIISDGRRVVRCPKCNTPFGDGGREFKKGEKWCCFWCNTHIVVP